ncbi:DUF1934 domain-containing protein [Pectinatus cerevisiiphilus]|uniref:Uncharacterized beta-barrel protein YwiB (DUF1934 family) n=1 Tax=Pectinatus cerevisiiphilus TaxID=86956 RepID=A0A4R3K3E3_9FIRM|nr:DUF1934 domain-containing protein [Pectinatus cerevisiiphilus]TCS77151.1 uncharacterized beta-barrel protein YwiB (DUF1934 family) [Pectinatus cerevisiiphilus]
MEKVILRVEGSQTDSLGETTNLQFVSEGQFYHKDGMSYVLYNEVNSSGMEGTKTLLKITDDSIKLVRKGKVEHEQFFSSGAKSASRYKTPYGDVKISVHTKKLDINKGFISSSIHVSYEMAINDKWQSDNELHIEITAADKTSIYLN